MVLKLSKVYSHLGKLARPLLSAMCYCLTTLPEFASAQVSTNRPTHFKFAVPIALPPAITQTATLSNNTAEIIRQELLDTNIVGLLVKFAHLTDTDCKKLLIAPNEPELWLYALSEDCKPAFSRFGEAIGQYRDCRINGLSKEFLMEGLTNQIPLNLIKDPDLRVVRTNYPMIPTSRLKKTASGEVNDKQGRLARQFSEVTLIDGKIGWRFTITYFPAGYFDNLSKLIFDSADADPALKSVFEEVNQKIESQMKAEGTFGQLGSIQLFWRLKKEILKEKGIDWRSPQELNGGIFE
jgi:hypothetical protein